jgi:hypothetical protein
LDVLKLLERGTIRIDDEARELTANKDFLYQLPHNHVWAVSYQDQTFWDDPEGKDFLKAHVEKMTQGVMIHRIFILSTDELASQKTVIEEQQTKGVECYILEENTLRQGGNVPPEDFVIYDDRYVRFAELTGVGPTTTLKHATLTCDPERVRQYQTKLNYFRTRSMNAKDVYEIHVSPQTPSPGPGAANESEIAPTPLVRKVPPKSP